MDTAKLMEIKKKWLKSDFLGGAIICNFILMKQLGLDIVYDSENELVQEYTALLFKRLESNNLQLALMVNVEIENCFIDKEEVVYTYLSDEIYEHFKNNNKEYPIQAIGLHVDVLTALICISDQKKVYSYLNELKRTYKMTFGRNSYLFCKSWCHILDEVMLDVFPEIVYEEFNYFKDIFSAILINDIIIYKLCIDIAIKRNKQEKQLNYIKSAIELCENWYKKVSVEKQKEIWLMLQGTEAMYCRNIGKYDMAILKMEEVIKLTEDLHCKLFMLSQIASILNLKRDLNELSVFFQKYRKIMENFQEPEENMAELYNLYSIFLKEIGDYYEANIWADKAIKFSERLWGKEDDITIKFICTKLMIQFNMGKFDEVEFEMQKLYDFVSDNHEKYPESLPLIINNMNALFLGTEVDSDMLSRIRCALESHHVEYDIASNIIFKCNLYYNLMNLQDNITESDADTLRQELQFYFEQNPYASGYLQFLEGELLRVYKLKDINSECNILKKMEECLLKMKYNLFSRENIIYYIVKSKKFIFAEDYMGLRNWIFSMWKLIIFPLFEKLGDCKGRIEKGICMFLHYYISLFISLALQYPQMKIKNSQLFEHVINFKYLEDLLYCNNIEYNIALRKNKWISVDNINSSGKKLIIECFNYSKIDMEDIRSIFGKTSNDSQLSLYQICFVLQERFSLPRKCSVDIISNCSLLEVSNDASEMFDTENISRIEKKTWNKLKKYLKNKEIIYVCTDTPSIQIPLGVMRINNNEYLGEKYQIIYCNTSVDVKDDIEINNFSESIYFGMSLFDKDKKENENKIQESFFDLPFTELEIRKLGALTGGKIYLDKNMEKNWFIRQNIEILYFATHTSKDKKDGKMTLIVGKHNNGHYIFLGDKEISEYDWGNTKLVILSTCEAAEDVGDGFGRQSLCQTIRKTGAQSCISSIMKVEDGVNCFFEVCLFKNLLQFKKISKALFETQKTMRRITKKEILKDYDYLDIYMDEYLSNYNDWDKPFDSVYDWGNYLLQMN